MQFKSRELFVDFLDAVLSSAKHEPSMCAVERSFMSRCHCFQCWSRRYERERYTNFLAWVEKHKAKLDPYAARLQRIYHGHTGRQVFKRIKMLADRKRSVPMPDMPVVAWHLGF